jgi:transcription initiation factor TFIIIB Brf1 subunit/transcription initiation factor TFIIB
LSLSLFVQNRAIEVFTQTILGRVVTSKSKEPIAAACVYLACRMENYPRTLDEVSFATGLDVRVISKMQQAIARKLQLSIGRLRPHHLVNRFAAKLKCPHTLGALSQEICLNITRLELLETHAPQLVAAGSIVLAALVENHPLDVSALSAVAVVTVSSMKLMYRNMLPVLTLVVPTAAQALAESQGRPLSDFPVSLEKIMAGELLMVKEVVKVEEITKKERVDVAATDLPPAHTSEAPQQAEEPTADAVLEDIICTLVEPVPARPSANNLTLLLGQCAELQLSPPREGAVAPPGSSNVSDSPGPDCAAEKPPSPSVLKRAHGEAAVAGEVRIAVETRVSTPPAGAITAARDAEGVVDESISGPEEDFSPLRKVRKVAMSKG